jgi:uncharacterized DUF497 family protein
LIFEWDENKNTSNVLKHGISFEEAQSVFNDFDALIAHDPEHSEDEERFIIIGISNKLKLLMVCHCYRSYNTIRIISARKATTKETKQYTKGV